MGMFFSKRSSVRVGLITIFLLATYSLLLYSPSDATLVLTGTVFSPVTPIITGSQQYAVSSAMILPSGATTFSRNHMLQMQTGLENAKWNIQIIVNGIPGLQQSAFGSSAFVNGYLLSYPTTNDVSITIAVNGTVPEDSSMNVTILKVTELDNAASPVLGSTFTVVAPITSSISGTNSTSRIAITTKPASTPLPTPSSGLLPVTAPVALLVLAAGYGYICPRK
jgi:hypothetical protein